MTIIFVLFILIANATITALIYGLNKLFVYIVDKSNVGTKNKFVLKISIWFLFLALALLQFFAIFKLGAMLCSSKLGNYIAVIIYTSCLAVMSIKDLYISPLHSVDSPIKAFRKGFKQANVNNIIPNLYLRTVIHIAYLVILVIAQLEELQLIKINSELSFFCMLNKYGIVIIFAIEKIISSINNEKKRLAIIHDTFVEQEKENDLQNKEFKQDFKELFAILKERRKKRKNNKNQDANKKNNKSHT